MKKLITILKKSGVLSLKTFLVLMIPVTVVSLIFFINNLDFNFISWSTNFFSFGHSFWGGFTVSLLSIIYMFFSFYSYEKLSSMLKVELLEISNGVLIKRALLLSFFFAIFVWYASAVGMMQADVIPITTGSASYHFVVLSLLTPMPFIIYQLLDKIIFRNCSEGTAISLTVCITLMLLILYVIGWLIRSTPNCCWQF